MKMSKTAGSISVLNAPLLIKFGVQGYGISYDYWMNSTEIPHKFNVHVKDFKKVI
jgi:hypothetical protein